MSQDLHAASNAVINKYLDKEVTVKVTRRDAQFLAYLINQYMEKDACNQTAYLKDLLADLMYA